MAKGIYYYKLVSPYPEDVTKNCKLTINEIDSNFLTLKDEDIKTAELNRDEKILVLTRNGEKSEKIVVDLNSVTYDLNVATEYSDSGASITIKYDGADGPKTVTFGNILTTDVIGKQILKRVITDGTLRGEGTLVSPLRLSSVEKTGMYAPVRARIDMTVGQKLPEKAKFGTRYVTIENVDDYGYLYNGKALDKIMSDLGNDDRGWHVPSKEEWDALLNSIEPCEYQNHSSSKCHVELGKVAGKYLKSECGWIGQNECGCRPTRPTTGCTKDDDVFAIDYHKLDKFGHHHDMHHHHHDDFHHGHDHGHDNSREITPNGIDKYGMGILPAGMVHLDAFDTPQAEDFKAKAFFWTSTHINDDVEQDRFVKEFVYKNSGVAQEADCPDPFYSIRLVKKYNGKNYFESEYIDGVLYKTVLFPESGQIWLAANYASKHGFTEVGHGHKNGEIAKVNNGEVPGKRKSVFINEWNGRYWEKKELSEGDTVVIEKPCFDSLDPKEITYCWDKVQENNDLSNETEFDVLDERECKTITIEREAQFNLEYRVYTKEESCDKDLYNTDDLVVERVINLLIPVIEDEKNDRIKADNEIKKDLEELEEKLDSTTGELEEKLGELDEKIDQEIEDRKAADDELQESINQEIEDRENADKVLDEKITEESERAKREEERIETDLYEAINKEFDRATDVEGQLWTAINGEINRAQDVEGQLWTAINDEIKNREEVDNQIWEELVKEAQTREEIDNQQWDAINNERDRATDRENEIDGQLIEQNQTYTLTAAVGKGGYNMILKSKDGKDEHSIKIEFDGNFGEF